MPTVAYVPRWLNIRKLAYAAIQLNYIFCGASMNFRMYAIYLGAVKLVSATIVEL
jgi:hypothetical protein